MRIAFFLAASIFLAVAVPARAAVVADLTFGQAGEARVAMLPSGSTARAYEVVLTRESGVVVASASLADGGSLKVTALTAAGVPDARFGTGGSVVLTGLLPPGATYQWVALSQLDDGRLLVRVHGNAGSCAGVILRLLPNGANDTGFNGGRPRPLSGCGDLRRHGDGWLLVSMADAFISDSNSVPSLPGSLAITRLTHDGAVDTSFGIGGTLSRVYGEESPVDLHVLGDGRLLVLVAGTTRDPLAEQRGWWQRFNADGSLDTGYGTGGRRDLPLHAAGPARTVLAVRNRLLLASRGRLVAELDGDGEFRRALDLDLGNGRLVSALAYGDDRVLLLRNWYSGFLPHFSEGAFVHLLGADLAPVATFGEGGEFRAMFGSRDVGLDAAGRMVFEDDQGGDIVVRRYRDTDAVLGNPSATPIPVLDGWALVALLIVLAAAARRWLSLRQVERLSSKA